MLSINERIKHLAAFGNVNTPTRKNWQMSIKVYENDLKLHGKS